MALPMDEQRILDEMERTLAADDPKLAARLAAFGQPGFGQVLRTRRARAALSLMVLVLVAAAASVIYMVSAFRPGGSPASRLAPQPTHSSLPTSRPALSPVHCAATFAPSCANWFLRDFARTPASTTAISGNR
jgi:Protein of unknown function (DUF3040)